MAMFRVTSSHVDDGRGKSYVLLGHYIVYLIWLLWQLAVACRVGAVRHQLHLNRL